MNKAPMPEQTNVSTSLGGQLVAFDDNYGTAYTRTDVAQAMVAAAYEAAGIHLEVNFPHIATPEMRDSIRALTPTDAKAALDRIVQEAVKEALENARGAVLAERLFDEISTSDHRAHNAALDRAAQAIAALKGGEA